MPPILVAGYLESKSRTTRAVAHAFGMTARPKTTDTLAVNLRYLLNKRGWSESELARRSKVAQKTINNILHRVYKPKVETCDQLARPFDLSGWHLILPDLIRDIEGGGSLSKLIGAYLQSPEEGQKIIMGIAEREAHYRVK